MAGWKPPSSSGCAKWKAEFRTLNAADDFNREVLTIEIDLNLPAARVIRVLERIAAW